MPGICIVVCYFGTWPRWLKAYLKTCAYNPSVQFLIFTDCGPVEDRPTNVEIVPLTLAEFNRRASAKLGVRVEVTKPYKICDLRPAFGVLFEDELRGFDFWGYSDLDVLYGDLRAFLTPECLAECDVLTSRKEYLSGHWTLYRNQDPINRLYTRSRDWRRIFTEVSSYAFDECHFLWHYLLDGGKLELAGSPVESMTHVVRRLAKQGEIRACFGNLVRERMDLVHEERAWSVRWARGRLWDVHRGEEIMYVHFHTIKDAETFRVPQWQVVPEAFTLSDDGLAIEWMF